MGRPSLARTEEAATGFWVSPWVSRVFLLLAGALSVYWFVRTPPPGYAVGALGCFASVMAFREMRNTQKVLALICIVLLTIIELRAIRRDREDSEQAQHERREQENASFARTAKAFDALQKRFDESMARQNEAFVESHIQFDATMKHFADIGRDTKTALRNITGGQSYAYIVPQDRVVPQDRTALSHGTIPLMICNAGNEILTGVTVTVIHVTDPAEWTWEGPQTAVGTLYPGEVRMTGILINPTTGGDGVDTYQLYISAQNGLVFETLHLRPSKDGKEPYWAYEYGVGRMTAVKVKGKTVQYEIPVRWQAWTDEPTLKRR